MTGRVFEIREFTLHDGPGIRTTVFLKGCPLRCAWCHNPEGQSTDFETMTMRDGSHRIAGADWQVEPLVEELLVNADIMAQSGGGVTFSGGEPLMQAEFVAAVCERLKAHGVQLAIETSGAADAATYRRVIALMNFVYQDLKHVDAEKFRLWTRGELAPILANIEWLKTSGVKYCLRVPVIPGFNDSAVEREAIATFVGDSPVEYLRYNSMAGAKYKQLGRFFDYLNFNKKG